MTNIQTLYNISANTNVLTSPPSIFGRSITLSGANSNFPRQIRMTPNGLYISRSPNTVLFDTYSLEVCAVLINNGLTIPPFFTLQPNTVNVVHPNAVSFQVAAASEIAETYQWQNYSGSAWVNLAASSPFSNVTTNALNISNTNTLNAMTTLYRCVATNNVGSSNSQQASLTVT